MNHRYLWLMLASAPREENQPGPWSPGIWAPLGFLLRRLRAGHKIRAAGRR
jgi:hypothetical protein